MTPNELISKDLRIRPVEAAQIADLMRIGEETNLSPWTAQHYLEEIKNPASITLRMVDENNTTVGFIVGRLVAGGEIEQRKDAEIYNIGVDGIHQGKGFGQLLLNAFAAECRDRMVENIWLEVRESNKKAIAFYEKNGFTHIQTRSNFYENPREHALLMRLILK